MMQHRLVAEHCIGRYLTHEEVVHHEDEDRTNNNPSNLWLFPNQSQHMEHHKRLCPRHDSALAESLRPMAADPNVSLHEAARSLGVSWSTVIAMRQVHGIEWTSAAERLLTEESVRGALQGRTVAAAASLLGTTYQTLCRRFPALTQRRALPGSLDARKEEIRSRASSERAEALARSFGCNPATVKSAIRRWAKEEPDAWSEILAFQQSRLGIRWSRARKA
jgi:hypothetical protein